MTILTVGHSNRPIEEFLGILRAHGVALLADIRTIPKSRHNPQFNIDRLPAALHVAGIGYVHAPGLGGLRHARKDSVNTGWRNAGFRGFADYMQTPEFDRSLEHLLQLAAGQRVALMCAESVPWRCHRSLVADALTVRGVAVEHILSPNKLNLHQVTSFARIEGVRVTYPAPVMALFEN